MDEYAGAQVATVHHCDSYSYNNNGLPFRQFHNTGFHETSFRGISTITPLAAKTKTKKKPQLQKDEGLPVNPDHYTRNYNYDHGGAQLNNDLYTEHSKSIHKGSWEGFSFMARNTSTEAIDDVDGDKHRWRIGFSKETKSTMVKYHNQYGTETSDHIVKPIALRISNEASIRDGRESDTELPSSDQPRPRKQTIFKNNLIDLDVDNTAVEYADDHSLSLKLCSTSFNHQVAEESNTGNGALVRSSNTNKRFRHSSPATGNNSSNNNNNTQNTHVCQVDDCHADLKHAKDYHRRHRVCELHSKSPQSYVQRVMQRFCQQCSR